MFPGFWGGHGGGWDRGFGGPCNRCGHCCFCNSNNNLTWIILAAISCNCRGNERPFGPGGFNDCRPGGFREEKKERCCEDVRSRRGSYYGY